MSSLSERQRLPAETDRERFLRPGETREQLYARSVREVQKWRKRRRWTLGISWAGFILGQLSTAAPVAWAQRAPVIPVMSFVLIIGSLLGLLVGMLLRPSPRNALNSLLQTDDVCAVGPLLEAMQMMIPAITGKAADALIRLLPSLREEHATLLTPLQKRYLRSLIVADAPKRRPANPALSTVVHLGSTLNLLPVDAVKASVSPFTANKFMGYHSEPLSVAVVQALAYIGDNHDLELIQRIAANPVQQAALRAQSLLEGRIKNLNERETHLRVASAPSALQEERMHAAQPSTIPLDTATLVRHTQEEPQAQSVSK